MSPAMSMPASLSPRIAGPVARAVAARQRWRCLSVHVEQVIWRKDYVRAQVSLDGLKTWGWHVIPRTELRTADWPR